MRHRPAGVPHEVMQQFEFLRCQTEERTTLADSPASRIQFNEPAAVGVRLPEIAGPRGPGI